MISDVKVQANIDFKTVQKRKLLLPVNQFIENYTCKETYWSLVVKLVSDWFVHGLFGKSFESENPTVIQIKSGFHGKNSRVIQKFIKLNKFLASIEAIWRLENITIHRECPCRI